MEVSPAVQSLFNSGSFSAELSVSRQVQQQVQQQTQQTALQQQNNDLSPLIHVSENFKYQEETLNFSVGFRKTPEEIQSYFESKDPEEIDEAFEDFKDFDGKKSLNAMIMKKMFNLEDPEKQRKIHSMLREIEKTEEFMEIIFGKNGKKNGNSEEYDEFSLQFELLLEKSVRFSASREAKQENSSLFVEVKESSEVTVVTNEVDPLVFDLGGNGIQTTGIKNGTNFDMTGDGRLERTSFVTGDDFLLAVDRNKNGQIDSIKELFGDANGFADGIAELKSHDSNKDGVINEKDKGWNELVLFNYTNGIVPIAQAGISEINLNRRDLSGFSSMGDRFNGEISFFLNNGAERIARDYYFRHESAQQ